MPRPLEKKCTYGAKACSNTPFKRFQATQNADLL